MSSPAAPASPPPPDFNRVKDCRYGKMIYNVNDKYIGQSFDRYGEYSEGEVQLFRQIVKPGDTVLDIGANIGAHTVFFARAVTPGGCVFAFEPQRLGFQTLCGNIAINSLTAVMCLNQAVGAARATVQIPVFNPYMVNNFGGIRVEGHASGEAVGVTTIDAFELPACSFIKIDVEGMEQKVLEGVRKTLERHRPVLYLEDHPGPQSDPLRRLIDSLGYNMYSHTPALFNPDNFFKNPENIFPDVASFNLLCLHKTSGATVSDFPRVTPPA